MLVSEFDFDLPEELIAQEALTDRAASRMLRLEAGSGRIEDCRFRDFPELLRPDDLLVFNNTRVFPARLFGRRAGKVPAGETRLDSVSQSEVSNPHFWQHRPEVGHPPDFLRGRVEVLLTRQVSQEPNEWECLIRPGRKIGAGERLVFGEHDEIQAEVISRGEFGERQIRFAPPGSAVPDSRGRLSLHESERRRSVHASEHGWDEEFFALIEKIGHVPLPPYISRADSAGDRKRYQTVYARERGSVAAPTAGLHFTPEVLGRIKERGIETAEITLHVGLATFQPVRVERVEEHRLHRESYLISEEAAEKINRARRHSRRVVAVGTTTVRTLEFAALQNGEVQAGSGEADIFIYPGYKFRVVGALLTNFHLPQSTLLMLVCALGGKEHVLGTYRHAVTQGYRFYSYGDCMFVEAAS